MTRRLQLEQALLWLFVLLAGIVMGGGLYEMRVIVPLWAHSPPDSAWYWEAQRIANPQYAPNSGLRFWIFVTPAHLLVSVATLLAGWRATGAHRRWLFGATITFIVLHVSALMWFVPTIGQILNSRSLGVSAEDVVRKTQMWVALSWARGALGIAAYAAGLLAVATAPRRE